MNELEPIPEPPPPSTDQEGAPPRRGKLKIFFGAFPGAGKTYAMLAAGRRMLEAGRGVVIGVADTHGAPETESMAREFEAITPAGAEGKAKDGEIDLDRILERRPDVVLIDNLAHANPEGSRHPNRWNDVDELLAAGIDVFTTMSVQELESLTDVVAEITGITGDHETVPDTFFDSAEETILVDMSADELLSRLRQGKVHVPDVEAASAGKFFRKGNLLALREIALRRTADVVEDEVQKYRAEKAINAVWKTQGHLLCCIGPAPGSEHAVRSAARLANQLDVDWTAAYVETPKLQRLPPKSARASSRW
jgi:two-component system sensor histidine kinase KdpD